MQEVLLYFEDRLASEEDAFVFSHPIGEIRVDDPNKILEGLHQIEEQIAAGNYLAGYFTYEAGSHLLNTLKTKHLKNHQPYLHFYVFPDKKRTTWNQVTREILQNDQELSYGIFHKQSEVSFQDYKKDFHELQQEFVKGNSYQANLSFRKKFDSNQTADQLYGVLREKQKVSYGAFLRMPYGHILSFSPELFFKKQGKVIRTQPMKGTTPRSADHLVDAQHRERLLQSEKIRAENLMIVDLLRNDLGRISKVGSVKVPDLFSVQSYETVHQLVSTIESEVDENISVKDIFSSLFPCGSITGAPKKSTMSLIDALEHSSRGVYTGAIGYFAPNGDACFNVAIRTLQEISPKKWEYGVGGGVLVDSSVEEEWEECLWKSRYLESAQDDLEIFESLYCSHGQMKSFEEHVERMKRSCKTFGIPIPDFSKISLPPEGQWKIRLSWSGGDELKVEKVPLLAHAQSICKVRWSERSTNSKDIFLFHKTNRRNIYKEEYDHAEKDGFYDVLFINEKGHVTEASRHNVFFKKEGSWKTPAIHCGLLPGIERAKLLKQLNAEEGEWHRKDVESSEEVILCNSVRGAVPVHFEVSP